MWIGVGGPYAGLSGGKIRRIILRTSLVALWAFTIYQSSAIVFHEVREHTMKEADIVPGQQVSVWDSKHLELTSWSTDPFDFRWAVGRHASLAFWQHASFRRDETCTFEFRLVEDFVEQQVETKLNGSPLPAFKARAGGLYREPFPCQMLRGGKNTVDLEFPNAVSPRSRNPALSDERLLGIGLQSFSMQVDKKRGQSPETR